MKADNPNKRSVHELLKRRVLPIVVGVLALAGSVKGLSGLNSEPEPQLKRDQLVKVTGVRVGGSHYDPTTLASRTEPSTLRVEQDSHSFTVTVSTEEAQAAQASLQEAGSETVTTIIDAG